VFRYFKAQAVSELILDLRYNGGGYAFTAEVLASMIVPEKEVNNGSVFQREIYNSILAEAWGEEKANFKTDFSIDVDNQKIEVSTTGANLNISKMHVIMTGSSASASESLVCGLLPYMDIEIVGQKSHGKFCGGLIVDAPTWYGWMKDEMSVEKYNAALEATDNWGIYVMVSRYADKDGNTACMPDGFVPDVEATDNPLDGYQLGDENESMLSVVLNPDRKAVSTRKVSLSGMAKLEEQMPRVSVRIINPNR
jgi:C-terminal processing protease CtpA/Prc